MNLYHSARAKYGYGVPRQPVDLIASPPAQKFFYGAIIATEATITMLCLTGAVQILWAIGASGSIFNRAKATATYGLTLAFVFWFVGFMVLAGEWFTMWQSIDWNGQQPAFRFIGCVGFVLIYLSLVDSDLNHIQVEICSFAEPLKILD